MTHPFPLVLFQIWMIVGLSTAGRSAPPENIIDTSDIEIPATCGDAEHLAVEIPTSGVVRITQDQATDPEFSVRLGTEIFHSENFFEPTTPMILRDHFVLEKYAAVTNGHYVCKIHAVKLLPDLVPIRYGLISRSGIPPGKPDLRASEFPNANTDYHGGCVVPKNHPTTKAVLYCPVCRTRQIELLMKQVESGAAVDNR